MLINFKKKKIQLIDSHVNNETLQEIFKCIRNSSCPEAEAEYLAQEFHLRIDELFLTYLDNEKKLATQQKIEKTIAENNKSVTHERRKSSPQFRLKYGVLKLLNEVTQKELVPGSKSNKNESYKIKNYLSDELSRYDFRQKQTGKNVSSVDVLNKLENLDFNLKYIDFMVNEIMANVLENFDVSIPSIHSGRTPANFRQ